MNEHIIYGVHSIKSALDSNQTLEKILISITVKKSKISEIIAIAKQQKIVVQFVPFEAIAKKAKTVKHQGILAYISPVSLLTMDELLTKINLQKSIPIIALLDGIEDPHNVGAIIRSAEAAGLSGLVLPQRRSAPLSPVVSSTSAGAIHHLPIARVTNLTQSIKSLKKHGFWIIGSDEKVSKTIWELDSNYPMAIVIGSEGKGIRRLVKESCDFLVKIPMFGKTSSLNASVAAGLLFYEARRRLQNQE